MTAILNNNQKALPTTWFVAVLLLLVASPAGCSRFQIPRFDPTGRSIFLPRTIAQPNAGQGTVFGPRVPRLNPGFAAPTNFGPAPNVAFPAGQIQQPIPQQPFPQQPRRRIFNPPRPAFTTPAPAPICIPVNNPLQNTQAIGNQFSNTTLDAAIPGLNDPGIAQINSPYGAPQQQFSPAQQLIQQGNAPLGRPLLNPQGVVQPTQPLIPVDPIASGFPSRTAPLPYANQLPQVPVVPMAPSQVALVPPPVSAPILPLPAGSEGSLQIAPKQIVAPVGSEVVLLAGVCGGKGYYLVNEPIEWTLSQESVGNFVDVNKSNRKILGTLIPNLKSKIHSAGYATSKTQDKSQRMTRGTVPTIDDVIVEKGQAWISLTSPTEGTSYVTTVAPKKDNWPQRRQTATVHWLDAAWAFPQSQVVPAGQSFDLPVFLKRMRSGNPISDWVVRYEILNSTLPVGFLPSGSNKAEVRTNLDGKANVQIQQQSNQRLPGKALVRMEIIRPNNGPQGEPLKIAESNVVVTWTAPALEIQVTGADNAGRDTVVNYQIDVRNPGDTVARDVVVRSLELPEGMDFVGSQPKATLFGNKLEWRLGDVQARTVPYSINLQLRTKTQGQKRSCFEVFSVQDNLRTDACIDTFVSVPCIGMRITGPKEAKVGEEVLFNIQISNECDRELKGLNLEVNFDEGFEAPSANGLHSSPMTYRSNEPIQRGQLKEIPLAFIVRKPGNQCFNINVVSDAGDTAQAQKCVTIEDIPKPSVEISVTAPDRSTVGKTSLYRINVTNNGNTSLTGLKIFSRFSDSLNPQRATNGAFEEGDGLAWQYRELAAKESIVLEIEYECLAADPNALTLVRVETDQNVSDQDQAATFIQSAIEQPRANQGAGGAAEDPIRIPTDAANALQLSTLVRTVPVNVNEIAEVDVVIKNNRDILDQNIEINLNVPDGLTLVGIEGIPANSLSADRRTIQRKVMRSGETMEFKIRMRADKAGSEPIFKISANSDLSDGIIEKSEKITVNN